jgi:hypothetical protein
VRSGCTATPSSAVVMSTCINPRRDQILLFTNVYSSSIYVVCSFPIF